MRMRKILSILKFIIMLIIVIGIPLYIYLAHPDFIDQFRSIEGVNQFITKYKTIGSFVIIGLQVLQILISIIPGQFIQFASGYAYGFWFGYIFAIIGTAIGTIITFYMARILGRDAIHLIFGEARITKFVDQLNSRKAFAIIFVLFLIPGLPKDLIIYAAGLSEFRFKPFLFLSLVGRTPALMGTIMMGSMLHKGSYIGLIILAVIAMLTFLICLIKRHQLTSLADHIYNKLNKE